MRRKRLTLVLGLLLAVIASMSCTGPLSPEAKQLLQDGYTLYEAGDDAAAIEKLDSFLRENAKSSRAGEAYYLRGLAKHRRKDLSGAKADLNSAVARAENKELLVKALLAMGELAYQTDDMALAENMYRQALGEIKRGQKPSDQAHYRLGCVLQRQGRWAEADLQFDRVVYLFEGSKLAQLAGRRVRCTAWTIQVGAFKRKDRAASAGKRLREEKIPVIHKAILYDGRPLFVVQMGRFATYEQAMAELPAIQDHTPDAFVVPTP